MRLELGIPADAQRVLILSQSSHLDWDWLFTFDYYYRNAVDRVFSAALDLLSASQPGAPRYYYSIAEIGYLQRFVREHPDAVERLRAVGHDLRIVGGGITSPDNLLPSGEAFIRDYLVGKTWVDDTLGLPLRAAWLPDDFGHDAQLPVALAAMGLSSVGFSRVPDSIAAELSQTGVDFMWRAADGSEVQAYWMPDGYCQGDRIDQAPVPAPPNVATAQEGELAIARARIDEFLSINGPSSLTPYIFVPIGCDFAAPKPRLVDYARAWNETDYGRTGVWAVVATFDHYAQLVSAHRDRLPIRRFDATPYWTGFYASRPLLKTQHYAATSTLLGAEVFGAIADATYRQQPEDWADRVRSRTQALHHAWEVLVPSNHHDYVTGTAADTVYRSEQTPRLEEALTLAEAERDVALDELAGAVATDARGGESAVIVFNQLGFQRGGLVELPPAPRPAGQVRTGANEHAVVQSSAEGGRLFHATAPSMGYDTVYLDDSPPPDAGATDGGSVSLVSAPDGAFITVENTALRAVFTRESGWALTSMTDKASGRELIRPGAVANAIVTYADGGGLYRFGNEMPGCALTRVEPQQVEGLPADILEVGPLRARLRAALRIDGQPFERTYTLVAGEPFLRMTTTGAAPAQASVMVEFPLAGPIDELIHGTPYHWDTKSPQRAAYGMTFEATHDFLVPRFAGVPSAAIFHAGIPAWAAQRDGLLVGALWRNARLEQCAFYGAYGTDPDAHTAAYALRVPAGIEAPEAGAQLREARAFQTPLLAREATRVGVLPARFSLASVTPDAAILTAAKSSTTSPDELLLRIYQPTNTPLPVEVTTAAPLHFPANRALSIRGRTALETPLDAPAERALRVDGDPARFTLLATRAITTLAIGHNP